MVASESKSAVAVQFRWIWWTDQLWHCGCVWIRLELSCVYQVASYVPNHASSSSSDLVQRSSGQIFGLNMAYPYDKRDRWATMFIIHFQPPLLHMKRVFTCCIRQLNQMPNFTPFTRSASPSAFCATFYTFPVSNTTVETQTTIKKHSRNRLQFRSKTYNVNFFIVWKSTSDHTKSELEEFDIIY